MCHVLDRGYEADSDSVRRVMSKRFLVVLLAISVLGLVPQFVCGA